MEDRTNSKEHRKDIAILGWFALGSLFGAMMLFSALMVSTNGTMMQLLRGNAQADMSFTVKKALQEALDEYSARSASAQTANQQPVAANAQQIPLRVSNTQGKNDAPVTIIEYSDFQCPYCLRYHTETFPRIIQDYVNAGKVKISYKQYPALGEASFVAAQAAECAASQNAFWGYYNALYDERAKAGLIPQNKNDLIKLAANTLRIDMNAFAKCLNEDQTIGRVQSDAEEGQRLGVRGTPTFFINGKLLVGAQPYTTFKVAIEDALKGSAK
jgi:protein-disulfide isomerase